MDAVLVLDQIAEVCGHQRPAASPEVIHKIGAPLETTLLRVRTAAELQVAVLLPRKDQGDVGRLVAALRPAAKHSFRQSLRSDVARALRRTGVRFARPAA